MTTGGRKGNVEYRRQGAGARRFLEERDGMRSQRGGNDRVEDRGARKGGARGESGGGRGGAGGGRRGGDR